MDRARYDVAVVGGGILGMTLARRLAARGARVTILEGATRSGGLAAPANVGGFTWDRFYHVILRTDQHLLDLLDELGLSDRLQWGATRTGFYIDGQLRPLSSSLDFTLVPPLSPMDHLRLAATILRASRIQDGRRLESIRAVDWLRRWSGPQAVERIWLPLLRARLGEHADQASAALVWAVIARLYGARQSPLELESFGYVDGGYATLLSRLEKAVADEGVERRSGARVTGLVAGPEGASVILEGGERRRFDAVVLTLPCGQIAALCPQLTEDERNRLCAVTYQGIICGALLLRRPLSPYYVTHVTDPRVPFTAVVETAALVDQAGSGSHSLVYLPRYVTQGDRFWHADDGEVEREFVAALERMYPDFRADDLLAFQVSREREMLAISTVGYSATLAPRVATSVPGIYIVNSAQIANGTLNVNETIGLAEEKAAELLSRLGSDEVQTGMAGAA